MTKLSFLFIETDRLCMSMQCCGQTLYDSFETYETFPRCIITGFECIVDAKNHEFGWIRFQNRVFFNYLITTMKKLYSKLIRWLGTYFLKEICQ